MHRPASAGRCRLKNDSQATRIAAATQARDEYQQARPQCPSCSRGKQPGMLGWLIAAANPGKFMGRLPAALASLLIMLAVPAAAQTLRIGLQEDPDTLDGAKNWSFVGRNVMTSICDKLVDIAPDASIVPMLATGWETSADGKAITFKLRPGVRFHDGEPFDAAAVKFSLDRALTLPDSRRKSDYDAMPPPRGTLTIREESDVESPLSCWSSAGLRACHVGECAIAAAQGSVECYRDHDRAHRGRCLQGAGL